MNEQNKNIEYLVVDTTAFIQNAQLQNTAENIITCSNVKREITNNRQLNRLAVLPYDLQEKDASSECIRVVTEFSKKTGDYPSLSATDIAVIALTYQLEKEKVGTNHLRTEPLYQKSVNLTTGKKECSDSVPNMVGFYLPKDKNVTNLEKGSNYENNVVHEKNELCEIDSENRGDEELVEQPGIEVLKEKFESLQLENCEGIDPERQNILQNCDVEEYSFKDSGESEDDDESGWITPSNIKQAKKRMHGAEIIDIKVKVACMTTDFAMQNVLKQMNLNVASLDGRMIKQLRTFILRCHTCFKTTSVMTHRFCPKCGNDTLKKVSVSLDENGKMQIHINAKRPLTGKGKRKSMPRIRGGKHPNNPILVADQPMPHNEPSKSARAKTDALNDDYIAGFSPFVKRDVQSRSAMLGIRPNAAAKSWMRNNSNPTRRRKK